MLKALIDFLLRRKTAGGLEHRHGKAIQTLSDLHQDAHAAHEAALHAMEQLAIRAKRIADVRDAAAKHVAGKSE